MDASNVDSPEFIIKEFDKLYAMGVRTLRISDEMFFLNRKYYLPILERIIEEDFGFNMWAYSRVDTVRKDALELFKKAGINWLALGIEAGNQNVRQEVSKGTFQEVNIRKVCKTIQDANINIISNTNLLKNFHLLTLKICIFVIIYLKYK